MVKHKITFICSICGNEYDKEAQAMECENRPVRGGKYNVGDIVEVSKGEYDGSGHSVYWIGKAVIVKKYIDEHEYQYKFMMIDGDEELYDTKTWDNWHWYEFKPEEKDSK
jgi:hypothetical protein